MLDINKQEMKYSQSGQRVFIPQTDENGDIVYEGYKDSDGNFVPYLDSEGNKIPKGEEVEGFSEPTTFQANISNKLYGFPCVYQAYPPLYAIFQKG